MFADVVNLFTIGDLLSLLERRAGPRKSLTAGGNGQSEREIASEKGV